MTISRYIYLLDIPCIENLLFFYLAKWKIFPQLTLIEIISHTSHIYKLFLVTRRGDKNFFFRENNISCFPCDPYTLKIGPAEEPDGLHVCEKSSKHYIHPYLGIYLCKANIFSLPFILCSYALSSIFILFFLYPIEKLRKTPNI